MSLYIVALSFKKLFKSKILTLIDQEYAVNNMKVQI